MRSLCIIGDSHIGAIKLGWSAAGIGFPKWTVTFYGSVGNALESMIARDGVLTSDDEAVLDYFHKTSGISRSGIKPDKYDAIAVVGLGLSTHTLSKLYLHHRLLRFATDETEVISQACHDACIRAAIEDTLCFQIARTLRTMSHVPVWMVPVPQSSIAIVDRPSPEHPWLSNPEMMAVLYRSVLAQTAAIASAENLMFFRQPEATLVHDCYTALEYARDGVGAFGVVKPKQDPFHMNGMYGAEILRGLLPAIETSLGPPKGIAQKGRWRFSLFSRQ